MSDKYDLVVIGGGAAGLMAVDFAASLGARVALVERSRIGGDCTWTGCVPSKALLKVAGVAHQVRTADRYGIEVAAPTIDMPAVRTYIGDAIDEIYTREETPQLLRQKGIDVFLQAGRFLDPNTLQVGDRRLTSRFFLITTGASPLIPAIPGLEDVPYFTYETLFDNEVLPGHLLVIGAGPIGAELAQAYRRLGSEVTLVDVDLLPLEDPEVSGAMRQVFTAEGIQLVSGLVTAVSHDGEAITAHIEDVNIRADMLLVATGRRPNINGLDLDAAGVAYSDNGIGVDTYLRTNASHILAAGDCTGGPQYTHYAGWQGFQAVRNALLPHRSDGVSDLVPRVTFTDPEVAHVGLSEAEGRQRYGNKLMVSRWDNSRNDRSVVDNRRDGFIKVIHMPSGRILGASIVGPRAGELITEFTLALKHNLKLIDLAYTLHPYPTYASPVMMLAAQEATNQFLNSTTGRLARRLSGIG